MACTWFRKKKYSQKFDTEARIKLLTCHACVSMGEYYIHSLEKIYKTQFGLPVLHGRIAPWFRTWIIVLGVRSTTNTRVEVFY